MSKSDGYDEIERLQALAAYARALFPVPIDMLAALSGLAETGTTILKVDPRALADAKVAQIERIDFRMHEQLFHATGMRVPRGPQ